MEIKLSRGHFCEKPLRSCKVLGFVLTEAVYPSNYNLPRHSHERSCFMSVLQGSVTETYAKKKLAGNPTTLIFRPSGEVHSDRFDNAGGRLFLIEIENWWLERVREHSATLANQAHLCCGLLTAFSVKLYREFRQMDGVSGLAIEGLMLEMIAEATRNFKNLGGGEKKPPRWIEQAREILHARFAEQLTLSDIAESIGVHPVHLGQMFPKFYRHTLGEYVRRLRIDFVCRQLVESNVTIADAALSAGFSDQSHLTRIFKRQMKMTPGQYRLLHRSS